MTQVNYSHNSIMYLYLRDYFENYFLVLSNIFDFQYDFISILLQVV